MRLREKAKRGSKRGSDPSCLLSLGNFCVALVARIFLKLLHGCENTFFTHEATWLRKGRDVNIAGKRKRKEGKSYLELLGVSLSKEFSPPFNARLALINFP